MAEFYNFRRRDETQSNTFVRDPHEFYTGGHSEDPAHFSRARDLARTSGIVDKAHIRPTHDPSQAQDDTVFKSKKLQTAPLPAQNVRLTSTAALA